MASLLLIALLAVACEFEKPNVDQAANSHKLGHTQEDGFLIPEFNTAGEQYQYAKSLSGDPLENAAALKVLITRFPHDRLKTGYARLELAYLKLGTDFRLAKANDCHTALAAYEKIVWEYKDVSAICVKARWYMAWIYTDLLHEKEKGLGIYRHLAQQYPHESYSRVSPVPWLELVFPNNVEKPYSADDKAVNTWASLALLEVIRNTTTGVQKRAAFDRLWNNYPQSLTTGYALREMLQSGKDPGQLAGYVREYIKFNTVNPALIKDLQAYFPPESSLSL